MPFNASNDPRKWQDLYTERQAHFDSLGKVSRILIPCFSILLPFFYLLLYISKISENNENSYASIAVIIFLFFAAFIFLGFGLFYLFRSAAIFLAKFHDLPSNENAAKIVGLRVFGKQAMPPPLSSFSYFKFPEITVKDGELDPPEHWSSIIGGPVKLNIQSGNAVYIERGMKFSRIVGQGTAFLHWDERITAAVNLGPQYETFSTTAWTKDGIKLDIEMNGEYFLGGERREGDENILIPYDPEAIRKAVEYTFKSDKAANEWLKSATGQTKGALSALIPQKYLDELFMESRNETMLLSTKSMKDLVNNVNAKLREYGVILSSLQITNINMPDHIKQERLKTWGVERTNIATIASGEVKAHQIHMREKARAEMQRDLIISIANSLENMDTANFSEPLLLALSNYLDHSLDSPQVRANMAKESIELLEKMQEILKFPLWLSGEESRP